MSYININSRIGLSGKAKCTELLEKTQKNSLSPWNRQRFLKHNKIGPRQTKNFYSSGELKANHSFWKKTFSIHVSDNPIRKRQAIQIKQAEVMKKQFAKGDLHVAKRLKKWCSTSKKGKFKPQ